MTESFETDFCESCRIRDPDEMIGKIEPHALCAYMLRCGWKEPAVKREGIRIFQHIQDGELRQVTVPMSRDFADYDRAMYRAAAEIGKTYRICVWAVLRELAAYSDVQLLQKTQQPQEGMKHD